MAVSQQMNTLIYQGFSEKKQKQFEQYPARILETLIENYAVEAVTAFLPVIMKQIGITEIAGICLADNLASAKVMERCGFTKLYEGKGNYQGQERIICKFVFRGDE